MLSLVSHRYGGTPRTSFVRTQLPVRDPAYDRGTHPELPAGGPVAGAPPHHLAAQPIQKRLHQNRNLQAPVAVLLPSCIGHRFCPYRTACTPQTRWHPHLSQARCLFYRILNLF